MVTENGNVGQRTVPGAMERTLRRELADGGLIEFEEAPAGWLTQAGEIRRADWRAYHFTPPAKDCEPCKGTGRVAGKTSVGRSCALCKGTGNGSRRFRLPSVTTLLDGICPKGGLPPWYEARGIEGTIEAVRLGLIDPHDPASAAMAVDVVRDRKLGAERARDEAAGRGLNVHECLEHYLRTGEPPSRSQHPVEHRGYLQALTRWLLKADPEPVAVEQLVVHPEDGYAGRLDLRARLPRFAGALTTIDAKSQERGGIFLGAHAQVALYERGAVRCGDEPAEHRLVVVFAANGDFREMLADHSESFTDAALAWIREGRPVDSACESANRAEKKARQVTA